MDTPVTSVATLAVTKTAQPAQFTPGTAGSYLVRVTNNGPSDEGAGITITDTLPAGETYVAFGGIGWSCTDAAPTVTCTDSQPLLNGAAATVIDLRLNIFT